jgi:hypothetical protein
MYKLISNFYGQISTRYTLKDAVELAKMIRKNDGEIVSVYYKNDKIYEAK